MTSKSLETKGWSARELARACGLATRPRSLGTADAIALPSPTTNFLAVLQRSPSAASRGTSSAFVRSAIQSFGRSTRRIRHGEDTRRHAAPPRPVAGGGSTLRIGVRLDEQKYHHKNSAVSGSYSWPLNGNGLGFLVSARTVINAREESARRHHRNVNFFRPMPEDAVVRPLVSNSIA